MQTLFPPEFVRGIQQLRIVSRHPTPGHEHGEHPSRSPGVGMDFRDFRPYVPGDDVRRIDWNVYRRSGRLFLRLFDEPFKLNIHVLLDMSASMFFEAPPRADAGRRIAAGLAAAAAHQHDRVSVYPFGHRLGAPMRMTPTGGLLSLLSSLAQLEEMGRTDLNAAVDDLARLRPRPGIVAVISDFFDPAGIDAVVGALGRLPHRVVLAQICRSSDEKPELNGDLQIIDCENGEAVHITADSASLAAYRRAYERFQARLHRFAVARRAPMAQFDSDKPILPQLHRLFTDGKLRL